MSIERVEIYTILPEIKSPLYASVGHQVVGGIIEYAQATLMHMKEYAGDRELIIRDYLSDTVTDVPHSDRFFSFLYF